MFIHNEKRTLSNTCPDLYTISSCLSVLTLKRLLLTDWNATSYDGELPIPVSMSKYTLPLALNYLTPLGIGIIGIGAVAAAVMSSADSCILSASSIITKNIWADIIRPRVSCISDWFTDRRNANVK